MRNWCTYLTCALALVLCCSSSAVFAQDECAGAVPAVLGSNPLDNTAATTSADPTTGGCAGFGNMTNDLWWTITAPESGTLTVATCNTGGFDSDIEIYSGACGATTALGCAGDTPGCAGFTGEASVTVHSGNDYLIRIGSWGGESGTGTFDVSLVNNDECADAIAIGTGTHKLDNNYATTSADVPTGACAGFGNMTNDVWFSMDILADGLLTVATCNTGGFDSDIEIYSGACGATTALGCAGDTPGCAGFTGEATVTVAPGAHLVRIGSWGGEFGSGSFDVSFVALASEDCTNGTDDDGDGLADCADPDCAADPACAAPANDECAGAITVLDTEQTEFNTDTATGAADLGTSSCDGGFTGGANDVWFKYNPTVSYHGRATTCEPGPAGELGYDTDMTMYTGPDCANLTEVACSGDLCTAASNYGSGIFQNFDASETYWIRIGGWNGDTGTDWLTFVPSYGDECNQINYVFGEPASGGRSFNIDTTTATSSGVPLDNSCDPCCMTDSQNDVWLLVAAAHTGTATISTCEGPVGAGYDTDLSIWSFDGFPDCSLLTQLACNGDAPACDLSLYGSRVEGLDVVAGTFYFCRVGGWNGDTGNTVLTFTSQPYESCANGVDDNDDGLVDCDDPQCAADPACTVADNCGDILASIGEGDYDFDNLSATNSGMPVDGSQCPGTFVTDGDPDVWFAYNPSGPGVATFSTCEGIAGYDTDMIIYQGACSESATATSSPAAPISSSLPPAVDVMTVTDAMTLTDLDVGVDISHTWDGDVLLTLESPAATVVTLHNEAGGNTDNINVTYDDAGAANGAPYDNAGAAMQPTGPGTMADFNGESTNGDWTMTAGDSTGGDDGVLNSWTMYMSGGSALTQVACNGDAVDACAANGFGSRVSLEVDSANTYYVRIGGYLGTTGSATLSISLLGQTSDACDGDRLTVNEGTFGISNVDATNDAEALDNTLCAGTFMTDGQPGIWVTYEATITGTATFSTCNPDSWDTDMAIYMPDCATTNIACNGDSSAAAGPCQNYYSQLDWEVVAGDILFVRIGGYLGATGSGTLDISVVEPLPDPVINEIRIDQVGGDTDEFFELAGLARPLDGLYYIVIGDGSGGSGTVEAVATLAGQTLDASGFWAAAEASYTGDPANIDATLSLNFENSDNVTHMLVENFTGGVGDDLDTDDDGILDSEPWDRVVDSIALIETDPAVAGEQVYSATQIGPDGTFVPGHVTRCPDGGPWAIAPFATLHDSAGLPNICPSPEDCANGVDDDLDGLTDCDDPDCESVCFTAPVASMSVAPDFGLEPLTVTLTDASDDGGDAAATLDIDWGDTATEAGTVGGSATHDYNAGTWTASVTITNAAGTDSASSGMITVLAMGDANGDGSTDVADALYLAMYKFQGGPAPACPGGVDVNGDGSCDVGDIVYLLQYLFTSGPAPVPGSGC